MSDHALISYLTTMVILRIVCANHAEIIAIHVPGMMDAPIAPIIMLLNKIHWQMGL